MVTRVGNVSVDHTLVIPKTSLESKDIQIEQEGNSEHSPRSETEETVPSQERAESSTTSITSNPKVCKTTRSGRVVKPPDRLNL